jgi:hypothetical protein
MLQQTCSYCLEVVLWQARLLRGQLLHQRAQLTVETTTGVKRIQRTQAQCALACAVARIACS